ncbi:MAG: hypothetical protein K0R69_3056, partial [Clostridia bacterium]|nr:hypothetical protein [Clostridia bacterium]
MKNGEWEKYKYLIVIVIFILVFSSYTTQTFSKETAVNHSLVLPSYHGVNPWTTEFKMNSSILSHIEFLYPGTRQFYSIPKTYTWAIILILIII